MLHPVGPLPAVVYWRRRLLVLGCAVGVLGGGGWLGVAAATGSPDEDVVRTTAGQEPAPAPALDQIVPSLAAIQLPTAPTAPPAADPAEEPEADQPQVDEPPTEPAAVDGGPCSNDMIGVEVRPTPASSPVGSKPTFDLVVTNVSPVSCVRSLDKGLQEIVMVDAAGTRVWGSNDCFPEETTDPRTLQPGESVVFPVVWGGLSSTPGCTAERVPPPPGDYGLRGRLDTATSPDATFTLT
ncbi:MucR family transcriptional regulator [Modestobacter sp. VKM Ac-2984]|uniref:MucR family transcriptional regulator n=1 Tax=Modestobacter sp. VKM Ac-2984 TaxID=3004138 RepID=UPI0022AB0FC7|nr:MucR family transcriptional regulator [Modestobacter sp. VKM Ac-2984]MCZ2817603.1 MucR family transcriptional regulator [Modestobacter sp. VKM Ac-2984]